MNGLHFWQTLSKFLGQVSVLNPDSAPTIDPIHWIFLDSIRPAKRHRRL